SASTCISSQKQRAQKPGSATAPRFFAEMVIGSDKTIFLSARRFRARIITETAGRFNARCACRKRTRVARNERSREIEGDWLAQDVLGPAAQRSGRLLRHAANLPHIRKRYAPAESR